MKKRDLLESAKTQTQNRNAEAHSLMDWTVPSFSSSLVYRQPWLGCSASIMQVKLMNLLCSYPSLWFCSRWESQWVPRSRANIGNTVYSRTGIKRGSRRMFTHASLNDSHRPDAEWKKPCRKGTVDLVLNVKQACLNRGHRNQSSELIYFSKRVVPGRTQGHCCTLWVPVH